MQIAKTLALTTLLTITTISCATPGKHTGQGAAVGAAAGAIIGGTAGGVKGAVIGAGAGVLAGGAVGNILDKQANELKKVADTKRTEDGILVNLKNDLLFATDSAVVKPKAIDQLTELGQILAKYPDDRIKIFGHTDDVGPQKYNEDLSTRRADAVRKILESRGVKSDQMLAEGMGETQPAVQGTTPAARAKNRRVELVIDMPGTQTSKS